MGTRTSGYIRPRDLTQHPSFPRLLPARVKLALSAVCALVLLCGSGAGAQSGPVVAVSTPVLTVEQLYRPANMRDPLKVSTVFGDEHSPKSQVALSDLSKSTFSVYNLSLTGIMEDSRSKEAMLADKTTGSIYLLKGGRLMDSKKKLLPGVTGVIKGKQVILLTEDKKVHQLNLREKE